MTLGKRGMAVTVIALISMAFSLLLVVLLKDDVLSNSTDMNNFSNSLIQEKTLVEIDGERRASIKKITAIISRYNLDMDKAQKNAIAREIYNMSQKFPNLNVDFICATITHESAKSWNPAIISKVGAMGLMQIMPATGAFLAAEDGIKWTNAADILFNPIYNIRLGCRYLNDLIGVYDEEGGLAAYNGGPRIAELWLAANRNNDILYPETRDYIPAVLKLYEKFRSEEVM
jgi:hypothetical protein